MANQPIPIEQNAQILGSAIVLLVIGVGSLYMMIFLIKRIPPNRPTIDITESEYTKESIDDSLTQVVYIENKSKRLLDSVPIIIVVITFIILNLKFILNLGNYLI